MLLIKGVDSRRGGGERRYVDAMLYFFYNRGHWKPYTVIVTSPTKDPVGYRTPIALRL